jgi:competence ComEA-like helix-hairpin-helix protein
LFAAAATASAVDASEMQTFTNCRYVASDWADGDSFLVELEPGREQVVRLYFVDCPETTAEQETDQRRLREQTAHFGLEDPKVTMEVGRQAKEEVARLLAKPFTVRTIFASALGRASWKRVYAFVTTADGKDLGEQLLDLGLARSYGVGRGTPGGASIEETREHMDDLELQAALQKKGLWARTDPAKLAALREARRKEVRQAEEDFGIRPDGPVKVNTASLDELDSLPGVGPVMAQRIVEGRPYAKLEDLNEVPGVGRKTLEKLKDLLDLTP